MATDRDISILLGLLDEAYDRKSWHGTNLRGSLRNLTVEQAAWRPSTGRHNAWELILHAAYWKYVVRLRFEPGAKGSFPIKGSNWFERPVPGHDDEAALRRDIAMLGAEHTKLRKVVASLRPRDVHAPATGTSTSNLGMIRGAAAHDLYHAGQIQLLKRLSEDR